MPIRHKFVSPKKDATDATLVRPSNWNDDHDLQWSDQELAVLGGEIISLCPAGQPLSGQRVVIIGTDEKVYYADCTNLTHLNRVLGITTGAVIQGEFPSARIAGQMSEPTWNWDLDKFLYLSTNGNLTQTPPASGFLLQMGWPISATSIMVEKKEVLILA